MKKKLIVFLLLIIICLISCSKLKEKKDTFVAMSTYIDITLYGEEMEILDEAYDEIKELYKYIHKLSDPYNAYNGVNNLYTINNSNEYLYVDFYLFDMISIANSLKTVSKGYFNPFMGRLNNIYKDIINKNHSKNDILNENIIIEELEIINNTDIELDEENIKIKRIGNGQIDLGAIAKGYATEKAKEILEKYNINSYIINAGNSSLLLGTKNENDYFNVGIKNIDNFSIKVMSKAIATSSIYEQQTIIDEEVYHHIINPYNGKPSNNYDIITLIGSDSTAQDALSTAFMSMTIDEIKEICDKYNYDVLVFKNNKLLFSSSLEQIYE